MVSHVPQRRLGNIREGAFADHFNNLHMFSTDLPASSRGMKRHVIFSSQNLVGKIGSLLCCAWWLFYWLHIFYGFLVTTVIRETVFVFLQRIWYLPGCDTLETYFFSLLAKIKTHSGLGLVRGYDKKGNGLNRLLACIQLILKTA